ncbi:MAG: threonylcarbamoyl-AMP synthase [Ruminococcaceae bacterium]|nr:threonylcarbamoyl-AMP synthase [Oscillospiraceae bacterium]
MQIIRVTDEFEALKPAAQLIRQGGLVAFPTETVYGLGANALQGDAVANIFKAKGRPSDNPLIVHISDLNQLEEIVSHVSEQAKLLMERFWPGPLTLIMPKNENIPDEVTAGLSTVGVRFPKHPAAQALISMAGVPIAAPSANTSGKPSPTTAQHVIDDLFGKIDAIIDGGNAEVGLESTIVDVSGEIPVLLRPGGITYEQLCETLGEVALGQSVTEQLSSNITAIAPGMKYPHYSPNAQVVVVKGENEAIIRYINQQIKNQHSLGKKVGAMVYNQVLPAILHADVLLSLGDIHHRSSAAANLFSYLRTFDEQGAEIVYAQDCGESGIGLAISNRLNKAAGYEIVEVNS